MMKDKNAGKVLPNVDFESEGEDTIVKFSDPRDGTLLERLLSQKTFNRNGQIDSSLTIGLHQLQHAKVMSEGVYPDLEEDIAGYHWLLKQSESVKEAYIELQRSGMPVREKVAFLKAKQS